MLEFRFVRKETACAECGKPGLGEWRCSETNISIASCGSEFCERRVKETIANAAIDRQTIANDIAQALTG